MVQTRSTTLPKSVVPYFCLRIRTLSYVFFCIETLIVSFFTTKAKFCLIILYGLTALTRCFLNVHRWTSRRSCRRRASGIGLPRVQLVQNKRIFQSNYPWLRFTSLLTRKRSVGPIAGPFKMAVVDCCADHDALVAVVDMVASLRRRRRRRRRRQRLRPALGRPGLTRLLSPLSISPPESPVPAQAYVGQAYYIGNISLPRSDPPGVAAAGAVC